MDDDWSNAQSLEHKNKCSASKNIQDLSFYNSAITKPPAVCARIVVEMGSYLTKRVPVQSHNSVLDQKPRKVIVWFHRNHFCTVWEPCPDRFSAWGMALVHTANSLFSAAVTFLTRTVFMQDSSISRRHSTSELHQAFFLILRPPFNFPILEGDGIQSTSPSNIRFTLPPPSSCSLDLNPGPLGVHWFFFSTIPLNLGLVALETDSLGGHPAFWGPTSGSCCYCLSKVPKGFHLAVACPNGFLCCFRAPLFSQNRSSDYLPLAFVALKGLSSTRRHGSACCVFIHRIHPCKTHLFVPKLSTKSRYGYEITTGLTWPDTRKWRQKFGCVLCFGATYTQVNTATTHVRCVHVRRATTTVVMQNAILSDCFHSQGHLRDHGPQSAHYSQMPHPYSSLMETSGPETNASLSAWASCGPLHTDGK